MSIDGSIDGMPNDGGLHLYFMSNPNQGDFGVMATEAKIVRDYIPIQDPYDFVAKALLAVSYYGRKIETMIISGHGHSNHITIGTTQISTRNSQELARALALLHPLALLRPHFAKNAVVTLWECRVGQANLLLQMLSTIWGGVKVQAFTGDVNVWNLKIFGGMSAEGDQIVCMFNNCWTGGTPYVEFDPRNPQRKPLPPH